MNNPCSSPRCRRALPQLLVLAAGAALIAGCSDGASKAKGGARAKPPVPVHIATAKPEQVEVYATYPGRVYGRRTVHVVSRIEGILEERHYNEGEVVAKGALLYSIEDREYQARVDTRQAELARAEAELNQAQRNWQRVKRLYKANAVSEARRSEALAKLETAEASVELAKANLESARIRLDYTTIKSPISGVTSLREEDVGSLVQPGARLVTVTQLDPVFVLFALPVDDAFARKKALQAMDEDTTQAAKREVTIILPNGERYPIKGKVNFAQSTIDAETGTVQMRAVVSNPELALTPGRFVRIRFRIATLDNAFVIPDKALVSAQSRPYVYVVVDGKAERKAVALGPNVAGGQVIAEGLSKGDRVIVSGLGSVNPGDRVKPKSKTKKNSADSNGGSSEQSPSSSPTEASDSGQAA